MFIFPIRSVIRKITDFYGNEKQFDACLLWKMRKRISSSDRVRVGNFGVMRYLCSLRFGHGVGSDSRIMACRFVNNKLKQ